MYAIIETGGKQYKVNEGDIVFVEKLEVNLVLLSACFNNCVHEKHLSFFIDSLKRVAQNALKKDPTLSGSIL